MSDEYNLDTDNFEGLLASLYCSECKVKTRIEYEFISENNNKTYFAVVHCIDCKKLTFFQYEEIERESTVSSRVSGVTPVKLIYAFPFSSEIKIEDVPEKIAKSYLEGVRCLDSNAPNGAVSMFRKSLQQICVDLGADSSKSLFEQVSILPSEIKPTATEIRLWGNLGTHEDNSGKIVDITNDQAHSIKKFLERIFLVLYQHPAEIKRLQDTRT